LVAALPAETSALHVFLEVTPYMLQLELACQHLLQELPAVLAAAGVHRLSFSILGDDSVKNDLPTLPPFDCNDPEAVNVASEWLKSLRAPAPPDTLPDKKSKASGGFSFARALRWATTSEALLGSTNSSVLLLACSKPADLEACIGLARRSNVSLQVVGVFGRSPEDPESGLQELVDAAAPGSSLKLFFGPSYWSKFIAARERQLRVAEESAGASGTADRLAGDTEIVSAKVFEMRLIERVMRECYSEEQQCEAELTCATRVFERTLIEREDLLGVLRGDDHRSVKKTKEYCSEGPATAR